MPAGLNCQVNITREYFSDDVYGGASIASGVVIHQSLHARLDHFMSREMIMLAPGIQQDRSFTLLVRPATIDVRVEDIVTLTFPPIHKEYGKRMRVRGIQRLSIHPAVGHDFVQLALERIEPNRTGKF